nr:MAG TPA: hypothetical protein [Caudoviricetes sp.]
MFSWWNLFPRQFIFHKFYLLIFLYYKLFLPKKQPFFLKK